MFVSNLWYIAQQPPHFWMWYYVFILTAMLKPFQHSYCMYLPNPSATSKMWHKINFKVEFWLEFWVFILLDWLPSSSSCTDSTDFFDSSSVHNGHHTRWVLYTASSVYIELMNISFCRSANTGVSMCRSPLEDVA